MTRPSSRRTICLASALFLLAACGNQPPQSESTDTTLATASAGTNSTSTSATSSPGDASSTVAPEASSDSTIPGQDLAADQSAAEAALLTLADFPAGWSEVPSEEDDEATVAFARRAAACRGSSGDTVFDFPAKARTGDFTNPDDDSDVSETVAITPSDDEAAAVVSGIMGSDTPSCLDEVYTEFFEGDADLPDGTSLSDLTVAPLNVTSVGDEVGALRVTATLDVSGIEIGVVIDQVVVRVGRSLAGLSFYSPQSPTSIERIDEYVGLAASRLPGGGSSSGTAAADTDAAPTTTEPSASDMLSYFNVDPAALPPGDAGVLAIIATLDPAGRESGVVVLRNNTAETIAGFEITAVGRGDTGELVATATQGGGEPQLVAPGAIAIATLYAGTEELPTITTWEYTVQTDTGGKIPVRVDEVAVNGNDVTGLLSNSTAGDVMGPISVLVVCLDGAGAITGYSAAYADSNELTPAAQSVFRGNIYHGSVCEHFVAGASGWDF